MVPDHPKQGTSFPMFKGCLEWIVNNQSEEGFGGEVGIPTIDGLPSTLACLAAPIKTWGIVGEENIEKVPTTYPVDGELIRLCLVNHIQRLGLAEHFTKEIDEVLENIYRSYKNQESREIDLHLAPAKIYKDSLAFRLLRMHGYNVTPKPQSLCFQGNMKQKGKIEHELRQPWIARLDHLDQRMWIEQNKIDTLWIEKASFDWLSCLHNDKLMQACCGEFQLSAINLQERIGGTHKSSILVTVADDLYDMEGSLDDLHALTQAVQRWDGRGLSGHGDIIFRGLDDIVSEIAENHLQQYGIAITENLRQLWGETFGSWMMETTWSKTGYLPSLDEYLQTGMTSIATHTMIMPALCFLNYDLKSDHYQSITKLLMASSRLLNDIQSYQKELEVGKKNFVILYSKANPKAGLETSIKHVKEMLDEMKKELLEQALMDGLNDLPKTCNHFHVSILRVFYMFFNSSNLFDSVTELLHDINRAIHVPIPIK
ncbi:hypothetical protein RHSIM_RhsimUnG0042700 [Rhododendron simsii]|uniref:Uncharacterized protein n=1 Tax=Rhododendron simsii TaxID=118357 RepID=A0A834FWU8_RHOSS|nr:hypothetical protein RHSIM_RhsimUnG0042700 [Rhododendron simsii]